MFFVFPLFAVYGIYIFAAVIPAVVLLRYIYNKDKIEKEPISLLLSLLVWGVVAAVIASILENFGQRLLSSYVDKSSPAYTVIFAFLVVAVVEEGAKFIFLKRRTWRDPNFNYRFDGIIYAVFVSLGFAIIENIIYVTGYGLQVAVLRAILAIPGHMGFAVFMGYFYGRAKLRADSGNKGRSTASLFAAYISAVLLHGFYDACAMIGTVWSTSVFIAFVVVMYIIVIRMIKKESDTDRPV